MIHNRIYAEVDAWTLRSPQFRLLVVPSAVTNASRQHLLDIDALSIFLRSRSGPPCWLRLFTVGGEQLVHERFAGLTTSVTRLTAEPRAVTMERVRGAFGEHGSNQASLVTHLAHGVEARVDVLVPEIVPADPTPSALARALDLAVLDWHDAKRACEVHVRGHDVPWAFNRTIWGVYTWGLPWPGLYPSTEPASRLQELYARAQEQGRDAHTSELIRSLALNRYPALAFTRDRLLFYVQQQRMARRFGFTRQEFIFECDYYLNHYYVLLWGGLDQLCWIMNGICGLGFQRRDHGRVGIAKSSFHTALQQRAPRLHSLVTDEKFLVWRRVIGAARHLAAHRGMTMASELFFKGDSEPTEAEVDAAVEASDEWQETVRVLGREAAENARGLLRFKERLRRLERAPERVLAIELEGRQAFVTPLMNVEYDFRQFDEFASKVASELLRHLESGDDAGTRAER